MSEGLRNDSLKRRIYVLAEVSDSEECKRLKLREEKLLQDKKALLMTVHSFMSTTDKYHYCPTCYNWGSKASFYIGACVVCHEVACSDPDCKNVFPCHSCEICGVSYHSRCTLCCPMGCNDI